MLELEIPMPPSVNHYWGHAGTRMFLTKKAKAFRESVRAVCLNQEKQNGSLALFMTVWPRDKRKRDLDNLLKGTLDALMHAGVIEDDSQIHALSICWDRTDGKINVWPEGKARIRIVSA